MGISSNKYESALEGEFDTNLRYIDNQGRKWGDEYILQTYKDGTPLVKGKTVTAFTDSEEKEMQLDVHMPFLLETKIRERGANFKSGNNWSDFSVRDENLVTGQNPQSSRSTAEKLIDAIENPS